MKKKKEKKKIQGKKGREKKERKKGKKKSLSIPKKKYRKCYVIDCDISASFNFTGNSPKYCSKHKQEGMVIITKTCALCPKQPSFGKKGETAKYCLTCRPSKEYINVRHKKCEFKVCSIRPAYGFSGESPRFCSSHKEPGMVDVNNKKCLAEGCNKQCNYNFPNNNIGIYCKSHAENGMIIVTKKRNSYYANMLLNIKYNKV